MSDGATLGDVSRERSVSARGRACRSPFTDELAEAEQKFRHVHEVLAAEIDGRRERDPVAPVESA